MDPLYALVEDYPWLSLLVQCAVPAVIGYLLHAVVDRIAHRAADRYFVAERIVTHTRRPAQWLFILLAMHLSLADAAIAPAILAGIRQALSIAIIIMVTVFVLRLISALVDVVAKRNPITAADNLQARSIQTKVKVLARIAMLIIGVLGIGSVLMTFPNVRQIGASLLASAGVAGIAVGFAARTVLGNLIAGIQIALTQPIRIDDVLIVENEWGKVEEITETYVVVKIWDERRLVVPLEYFIQKPFQNWTRNSAELIGSVYFWVDYRMPVPPLREKLKELVAADPDWDQRVVALQVTDVSEHAMQLRALASAASAGKAWDLRCRIREQMIAYMQESYIEMLPVTRAEIRSSGSGEQGNIGDRSGGDVSRAGAFDAVQGPATP